MVFPGIASISPFFQSLTMPVGLRYLSGRIVGMRGVATRSFCRPRCGAASSENFSASALNWSQLVFDSQAGSMAGLKGCMNGCMSVVLRSCISYQVAAGKTTSEYRALVLMRISVVTRRSSLPSGSACL